MTMLQKALMGNAIFSSFSAVGMLLFSESLANLFGLKSNIPFLIIGLGLLFFAGSIVYEIKQLRYKAIQWIIIQDALWVIGSIALLILQPFGISYIGHLLIADVAMIVAVFGMLQYLGLRREFNYMI